MEINGPAAPRRVAEVTPRPAGGVDVGTLTRLLNIGRRYFYELKRLPGTPPDVARGRYDAPRWQVWYIAYLTSELDRRGDPGGPASGAMLAARLKLISAQVQRIEMENRVVAGTLLEVETLVMRTARQMVNAKMRFGAIPSSLGPQLVSKSQTYCEQRLAVAIERGLVELYGEPVQAT